METRAQETGNIESPLYLVLGKIAGIWFLANTGYYTLLPALGVNLSYNVSPFIIGVYFLAWFVFCFYIFLDLFKSWLPDVKHLWAYAVLSLLFGAIIVVLIDSLTLFPIPAVTSGAHPSDLFLATPKYFFPKGADVLLQQMLITVLVLSLWVRFNSLQKVRTGYLLCFGGAHLLLFTIGTITFTYALIMTTAAVISTSIFPYLLLRVRGGFICNYAIHLLFYILLAIGLHAWPAPVFI